MNDLRTLLENKLRQIKDVDVHLYKDTDLMCVYYCGKEIAHFQDRQEIDVRMSQKFIKKEGLCPPADSKHHPQRSKNSRWMLIRFTTIIEVEEIVELMNKLIEEEYKYTSWGA